jgi:hypothetical protein
MVMPGSVRVLRIRALWVRRLRIVGLIGVHPQKALDPADDAADRASDHRADRAGASIAFIDAMRDAAGYALSVCRERSRECGKERACNQNLSFHLLDPLFDFGHDSLPGDNGDWAAVFCFKSGSRGL